VYALKVNSPLTPLIPFSAWTNRRVINSLGRLLRVDLIKWVSNVRPPVRPSTKSLFDFNEIWCVDRGRRLIHDGMQADPRSRSRPLESRKFGHFQRLSPPPFTMEVGK